MQVKLEALLKSGVPNRNSVVFLSLLPVIESLLDRGISKRQIYMHLREEGGINLSYSRFIKLCAKRLPDYRIERMIPAQEKTVVTQMSSRLPRVFEYDPYNREGDD